MCPGPLQFNQDGMRSPSEVEMEFEDVYITTKDNIKLHGWFMPSVKVIHIIS